MRSRRKRIPPAVLAAIALITIISGPGSQASAAAEARLAASAPTSLSRPAAASGALARRSTRDLARDHGNRGLAPREAPAGSKLGAPLPLASLPVGTPVTDQFESAGILFSGQAPFIADDGASAVNPTISGSPLFAGTVVGAFVKPGTTTPATVNDFSLNVGYIDSPGSTQMTVYNARHQQLGVLVATQLGFNRLESVFRGAASFSVSTVADEPAGWEINTIQVGPVNNAYLALGDSYSSGEGSRDYAWSQSQGTRCDTGPLAWPAQFAAAQNGNAADSALTFGPDTLIACQGEKTTDLTQAVNGEQSSELAQLSQYVTDHGPPALVTMSIGGNNIGFTDVLGQCYVWGLPGCRDALAGVIAKVTTGRTSLIADLANAYSAVRQITGPSTTIVIVGYPNLFPQPGPTVPEDVYQNCPWLRATPDTGPDLGGINTVLAQFSAAQSAFNDDMAVAAAQAGVQFIPIPAAFHGHELCTDSPYINPITPWEAGLLGSSDRNAGHPTVAGQAVIANAVASALGYNPVIIPGNGPARRPGAQTASATSPRGNRAAGALARIGPPRGAGGLRPARHARSFGASRRSPRDSTPLTLSGGPLAAGATGAPYLGYLISSGGTGADTWRVTGGSLPPGLSLDPANGTITGVPTAAGTYSFTAEVTDSAIPTPATATATASIVVAAPPALTIGSAAPPNATVGQPYAGALMATGGLGAITWAVTSGTLPAGLHLDAASGAIAGVPTASAVGATPVTVTATDGESTAQSATATETIITEPTTQPVAVTTTALPPATAGATYDTQLTSAGGPGPVSWSVTSGTLPAGLSLDPATGVISGVPTQAGTSGLTVAVADGTAPVSNVATASLNLSVAAAPPLTITPPSPSGGTEGSYYSATFQAQGGTGSYGWTLSSGGLPPGVGLDPGTGQILGVPTGTGSFSFGLTVTDSAGDTVTSPVTVTIAAVPLRAAGPLAPAAVGSYYTQNVAVSGGVFPYHWSLTSGTLPPGLSLDPATGAITGTPTAAGSFPLGVSVTDGSSPAQLATASVTLTVAAAPTLTVSGAVPTGTAGVPYEAGIGYAGGQAPYQWALTGGSLPPGLTLDPGTGMVTGTPTATGTYPVTVGVTDSTTPTPQTASIQVTFTISSPPPLSITPGRLPAAAHGVVYAALLSAAGGTAPYTWSLSSGTLPTGLTLFPRAGEIGGDPTGRPGTASFTVAVTDSATPPATVILPMKLTVQAGSPLTVSTGRLGSATQGSWYLDVLAANGGTCPCAWSLARGRLPAGLTLSPIGDIEGVPAKFGTATFTVEVKDVSVPTPETAKQTLTLTVVPLPLSAPSFTADGPPLSATEGVPFGYLFQASGNPAPRFTVSSGTLPHGLKLAGDGALTGTPDRAGIYDFTITATNGRTPAAVSPQIQMTVAPAPVITAVTPDSGAPGTPVTITGQHLAGAEHVYFNTATATITTDTASKIVTTVPVGASTGPIFIITPGGTAASPTSFTVSPAAARATAR